MSLDDSDNQPKAVRPTGEPIRGPSAEQRVAIERSQAWTIYSNGGGGDPQHFDGMTWLKMCERRWAREDEAAREHGGRMQRPR